MANPTTPSPGPNYRWNGDTWEWVPPDQRQATTAPTTSPADTSQYNPMTATPTPGQIQQAAAPVLAGTLPLSATGLSTTQLTQARDASTNATGQTTAGTGTTDASQWNTNGYQAPTFAATNYGDAPSGYDPTKWNDPNYQDPKYAEGRIYQMDLLAGKTPDQIAQDIIKAYPGSTYNGGDVINIPGIGDVDFVVDYGGQNKVAWQPLSADSGAASSGTGPAFSMPSLALPSASVPDSSTAADPNADPFAAMGGGVYINGSWYPKDNPTAQAYLASHSSGTTGGSTPSMQDMTNQAVMALLQTPQTVDAASLEGTPEAQAYNLAAQRAQERNRAALAEQASYNGENNSGSFDTKLQALNQQRGEGEAQFLGTLAQQKMQQNRDALVQGIQFAISMGQFDKAQAMQLQLAQLDAAVRRDQINSSAQTAANSLAVQQQLGMLGIGFDYDQLQANMNQQAANAAFS